MRRIMPRVESERAALMDFARGVLAGTFADPLPQAYSREWWDGYARGLRERYILYGRYTGDEEMKVLRAKCEQTIRQMNRLRPDYLKEGA